jgi:HK97 family phage prohead protease
MMDKLTNFGRIELKFAAPDADTKTMTFSGYGARFGNVDSYGDIIAPGAFTKSLAAHEAAGTMPMMFFNHDAFAMPIGKWHKMSEDDTGLLVEGELIDTATGRDAYVALKSGAITGLSIGFRVTGYEIEGKNRTITEVDLLEVSAVTFPANDLARVSDVKSTKGEEPMTDEDLVETLKEAGFDDEAVKNLFESRKAAEDTEEEAEDEEEKSEAKYNHAAVTALIRSIVATTKEIHV